MGKTQQSIIIDQPIQRVWNTVRDFHDMSWAPNVVTEFTVVGDLKGDQIGSRRVLNNAFHETLIELNESQRTFKYTIDEGPSPMFSDEVDGYVGVVRVAEAADGSTRVEWSSSWRGKDREVEDFCHPIYVALLEDLKKSLS